MTSPAMLSTAGPQRAIAAAATRRRMTYSKNAQIASRRFLQRVPTNSNSVIVRSSSDAASGDPTPQQQQRRDAPAIATDVRVRTLRGEGEIPGIVRLCAAVFKEVAVPMPDGPSSLKSI